MAWCEVPSRDPSKLADEPVDAHLHPVRDVEDFSGDVARVHLYRWGDGGAHFHVWFLPRPLGMVEAAGMMLPLWEDVLPNVPDEELAGAATRVGAAM